MRWQSGRRSDNVEDRRGMRGPAMVGGGLGIGGLILALVVMLAGGDPGIILQQPPGGGNDPGINVPGEDPHVARRVDPGQDKLADFTSVILASTEDVWNVQFRQVGREYREPKLRLFSGKTESACGFASAAVGPFYCPADDRVYLDLQFYEELRQRFRAPGDTAQAYVIAHEVGHHVQNQLGISDKVQRARQRASTASPTPLGSTQIMSRARSVA